MNHQDILTKVDGQMLAEAFPTEYRSMTIIAGNLAADRLALLQRTERFAVQVQSQRVLIPARLHFSPDRLVRTEADGVRWFVRALETRSNNGFERQRAARDLLMGFQPWAAPFILALVGEYVVEILHDISASMTPHIEQALSAFIVQNEAYWSTIKRRVASYWNAYYRSNSRDKYVGFEIVDRLEMARSLARNSRRK